MRLYDRQWALQIGGLDLSDLDIAFKVARSVRREPNTAEIQIWNLSRTSRATVEAGGTLVLRAGYEDPPVLFRGDSRAVETSREADDWVTTIWARDGGRAYSEARIARAYAAGTACATPLRDALAEMEIGEGNLEEYTQAFRLRNGAARFEDGYVAAGPCRRVVNDLVRAAGLRWSVQNGALQLMSRDQPLQSRSVVLSSDSGLIESPTWDERGRLTRGRRGILTAKALIQPGLDPGRKVFVDSEHVTGHFEIDAGTWAGGTRENDWAATLSLRSLSAA